MVNHSLAGRLSAPDTPTQSKRERNVYDLMTPGVTSIAESTPLSTVFDAFAAHGVHAVLVTGATDGRLLGWITTRGLLGWIGRDVWMRRAGDAITEPAIDIPPGASAAEAVKRLLEERVTHLIVRAAPETAPEGVVSDLDLVVDQRRT